MAVAFVLVALQAMNVGLLTRFMGYLGMFAGALFLFQITQVPVVQCFWLLALAYLLSGRWPTGVPPAWRTGRAEPWPSSAEVRAQRMAQGGGRGRRTRPRQAGDGRRARRGRRRPEALRRPPARAPTRPSASASIAADRAGALVRTPFVADYPPLIGARPPFSD